MKLTINDCAIIAASMLSIYMLFVVYENNMSSSKQQFLQTHKCMVNEPNSVGVAQTIYVCNDGRLYDYKSIPANFLGVRRD